MFNRIPHKPSWLDRETYVEFVRLYPPICKRCGSVNDLTVDHIIARGLPGSSNAVDNLQWLCRPHNSSKGPRPDSYWSDSFYWDRLIDHDKLRRFQRECVLQTLVDYESWFTQPFSQISGRLYLIAGIVGSGKTLAMPTLAFTLNFLIGQKFGRTGRRVDRMLILTKEVGLRQQIADELRKEIKSYGICGAAPRVKELDYGEWLSSPETIDTADVWVACTAMLYEKNGQPRPGIERELTYFPLICMDEPHFALTQNLQVVEAARVSLCVGFTGTPINADGETLKKFVKISQYTYKDVQAFDQSLKYISDHEDEIGDLIHDIPIKEGIVLREGRNETVKNVREESGYGSNLVPAKTVAEATLQYLVDCDHIREGKLASHRPPTAIADLLYVVHALIKVANKSDGQYLLTLLNSKFDLDHAQYPRDAGWHAEMVVTPDEKLQLCGRWLDSDHSFMRVKKLCGRVDAKCSRILIVVGMGREGLNNQYIGVYGLACKSDSVVQGVQGAIGRQARGVSEPAILGNGVLHVAPARLDTIRIITHEAFYNLPALLQALTFCTHMEEAFEAIPTLDQLIEGDVKVPEDGIESETVLTDEEKLIIIRRVGERQRLGLPVTSDFVESGFNVPEPKRKKLRNWVEKVIKNPSSVLEQMGYVESLGPATIVNRETPMHDPTDDELVRFVERVKPDLKDLLTKLNDDGFRRLLVSMYVDHTREYKIPDVDKSEPAISVLHRHYVNELRDTLRLAGVGIPHGSALPYKGVGLAIRMVLGVPSCEKFEDGGKWDTIQCHAVLKRPEIKRSIIHFAEHYLFKNGLCPDISFALGIEVEHEQAV